MNIETKFSLGDRVWILYDDAPMVGTIYEVTTYHRFGDKNDYIHYLVVPDHDYIGSNVVEKNVFPTKEELLKSL